MFRLLREKGVYQFLLLPVAATFVLYSIFLFLKVEPTLFLYSPLVAELLFVVMLTLCGFTRHSALRWARDSKWPVYRRIAVRSALNESYFLAQLLQGLYTLHLFAILFYAILPESARSMRVRACCLSILLRARCTFTLAKRCARWPCSTQAGGG